MFDPVIRDLNKYLADQDEREARNEAIENIMEDQGVDYETAVAILEKMKSAAATFYVD